MRERFEDGFEAWAGVVARWRLLIIALALLATGLSATQLRHIEIETSTESYLLRDDPARLAYDALREQFGRDEVLVTTIEPPEVFDLEFLSTLQEMHETFEDEVPHLHRITSLINIRSVEGRGDELIVGDLLEEMPTRKAELAALRERVLSSPTYVGNIISPDGRITAIILELDSYSSEGEGFDALAGFDAEPAAGAGTGGSPRFLTSEEGAEALEAAKSIAARFAREDVVIHQAGSLLVTHELSLAMARELPVFFGGALCVMAIALWVLFRRAGPCLISLVVVALSVVGALGTVGFAGHPFSILTQIMPSFMLAVGLGYSVHLFAIYLQRLDQGDASQQALIGALRHAGPPILMTALTTAAGLGSFRIATMPPVREFGSAALFGVAWTLVFNLTLLPALVCTFPTRGRSIRRGGQAAGRWLVAIGAASARNPRKVVCGALALVLVSLHSVRSIEISTNPIKYLAPDSAMRLAHDYISTRFGGWGAVDFFIRTGEENGLYEPSVMNRLDELEAYAAEFELDGRSLGATTSVLDVLRETHQALNANDPAFYAVPQDRALIAQELLLFENSGSDDLERLVDPQFQKARYSIRIPFVGGIMLYRLVQRLDEEVAPILAPELDFDVTGTMALIGRSVGATSESLIRTYTLALAVITPLMMLLIGSLRAGLVSMAPNLLPILLTLGTMPYLDTPLDIFTMTLGCIAIGLAVDDTLHFIHGFRARLSVHGDPHRAIEETLLTTGRALLFTSIVLSVGFLVLTFSSMANLRALGGLTALSISAAFVLDILVTPALLVLVTPGAAAPRSSASPGAEA